MASSDSVVDLDGKDIEGRRLNCNDYFFVKVGESVPVKPQNYNFNLQGHLPSQPLVVSERSQLIFVVHSDGFCVARTEDVMKSAEEIKEKGSGYSIQELSVVDVPIRNVHILALSTDSSTLGASVGRHIHLFSVRSLLNKEQEPFFTCSLGGSSSIKDIRWRKKMDNSYVVLSSDGKLYHGGTEGPLKDVTDGVDAVDWSAKGNSIAVARENALCLLSSKFKERVCISLSFKSWIGNSGVNCTIKVDCIRWVRPDCIILGCFQLTADGMEESYMVQVIQSKEGKITNASSSRSVLSFYDIFPCSVDDIVPFGSGPYLFLSYLEQCQLVIAASRKNVDEHIILFGWSIDDKENEAAIFDIGRDKYCPRIELQGNGDDNLILGLCCDKVSLCGKVEIELGAEEPRELSPYCVLFCLTLEGKLVMFQVASVMGAPAPSEDVSPLYGDEDDTPAEAPLEHDLSQDISLKQDVEIPIQNVVNSFEENKSLVLTSAADQMSSKETIPADHEAKSLVNSRIFEADGKQRISIIKLDQEVDSKQSGLSGPKSCNLDGASSESSTLGELGNVSGGVYKTDIQTITEVGSSIYSSKSSHNFSLSFGTCKELPGKIGSTNLELASQSWPGGKFIFSKPTEENSSLPSSFIQSSISETASVHLTIPQVSGGPVLSPVHAKDAGTSLVSANLGRISQSRGQRGSVVSGNVEPISSTRGSQLSLQENLPAKSSNYKSYIPKENYRTLPLQGQPNSEPNLSKQFGNVKEMANELDTLLQCIEGPGGFREACTVFQTSSVVKLEQGIDALSENCRMWLSKFDQQHGEIHHLLDKTVEVLAMKAYMQGIVKQATDSKYWDLWSRQKLTSELELKRRNILKINQDLTNQLIELERHFNTIEISKFGENGGNNVNWSALQRRSWPSRHMRSLHSLHNTMNSQLAVAEQLSKCLSKQMVVLRIDSVVKRQNVKKDLFEEIGIPYDGATITSPTISNTNDTPSTENFLVSSSSAAVKDQSRSNQSSALKSYERETIRRRRDSLGLSWANFEPPKTIMKRMVAEEHQKVAVNKLSFADKQKFSPDKLEGSTFSYSNNHTTPSSIYSFGNTVIHEISTKQASNSSTSLFRWANDPPGPTQSLGSKSTTPHILPGSNLSPCSSLSAPQSSHIVDQNNAGETYNLTNERSTRGVTFVEKSNVGSIHETKVQSENHPLQTPVIFTSLPAQTLPSTKKPNEMSKPTFGSVKQKPVSPGSSFSEFGVSPFSSISAVRPASSLPGKVLQFEVAKNRGQSVEEMSSSPGFSSPFLGQSLLSSVVGSSAASSSLLPMPCTVPTSSNAISSSQLFASSKLIEEVTNESLSSQSSSSASSSPFLASRSFSSQVQDASGPSISASLNLTPDSLKTSLQSPLGQVNSKTEVTQVLSQQSEAPKEFGLKLEPSVVSTSEVELSTGLESGSVPGFNSVVSHALNGTTTNAKPELPADGAMSQAHLSISGTAAGSKTESLDVIVTQEDEMEEEAPETSPVDELNLGTLGGFGLESSPNQMVAKANPFGGPFGNAGANPPASTPFTMIVPSGELFRPASFSFQSPQPSQLLPSTNLGAFSGGNTPAVSGFGQPAQVGAGQQALGSVLGAFGQSRQFGVGFASASSFTGGFAGGQSTSGFSNPIAAGGGFAGVASAGGGFAGLASAAVGGGFAGAAPSTGVFAGATGGGFGAFSNSQGSGGFSSFGSTGGTGMQPPSELFTQMRK